MAKMDKKWVVLCSAAVAAVYSAGYFSTESQAASIQPKPHPQVNIQTSGSRNNSMPSNNNQSDKTSTSVQSSRTASSQSNSLYKDGTYKGTGMNRRGYIEVSVTIKNDKITDVAISDFEMHYSESDIDGLPAEVLQKQSAQVTNVSGATYSTEAFSDAVQDALSQAQNG